MVENAVSVRRQSFSVLQISSKGSGIRLSCLSAVPSIECIILRSGGVAYGTTDNFGNNALENPVSLDDVHATIYHPFGIDSQRLTAGFRGLEFGLTGVGAPRVLTELLAEPDLLPATT
ncbi:MAG: DUF1501 domain-containing protein [Fuerstiella sp.]|nr:DUF1501 domain-containing protein [Fuerstiella sp.]